MGFTARPAHLGQSNYGVGWLASAPWLEGVLGAFLRRRCEWQEARETRWKEQMARGRLKLVDEDRRLEQDLLDEH